MRRDTLIHPRHLPRTAVRFAGEDVSAADKSVTRAGDFKGLGAILRAPRRSAGAPSSLASRGVKFRQVLSSFVKGCQAFP